MKGLLTVAAVPFRKTHNLNELGGQVVAVWPGLATLVDPLRPLTSRNFAYRYPAAEELSEPAPSAAAVLGTLEQIKLLREGFAALLS